MLKRIHHTLIILAPRLVGSSPLRFDSLDSLKSGRSRDAAKLLIKSPYKAESKAGLRLVGSSPLGFDSLKSGRSRDAAKLLYKAESKAGLRLVGSSPFGVRFSNLGGRATRRSCFIKPAYKAESKAGLRLVGSSPLGFNSLKSGRSRDATKSAL